jgi:hypothetical protein
LRRRGCSLWGGLEGEGRGVFGGKGVGVDGCGNGIGDGRGMGMGMGIVERCHEPIDNTVGYTFGTFV